MRERAMTAVARGSAPLFSMFSSQDKGLYRARREAFAFSLLAQALVVVLLTYFTCCMLGGPPGVLSKIPRFDEFALVFSGNGGGGGGGLEKLAASHGNLPSASRQQIVPPTVMQPTAMPKLVAPESVEVAPEVKLPQGGQIGDPTSPFSQWLSNGPGARGGIGPGCCGGVGPAEGPGFGPGDSGIYPAGKQGVTVPQLVYSPEPSFSDEARKAKQQGVVRLLLVVGKDGRPSNIRVGQSLGMGLDEKAIEAVTRWRFRPATLNGQPVATQIAVEVDFHLY
jgi:periplasmic protein TonB